MSVAGKREGLKHSEQGDKETTRSGLFYEAIRIIKEMRLATNNEYPKYAVWENVPGAFSSNKGWDFHAVLEALCSVCDDTVSIPEPYDKRKPDKLVWNSAGEIVGDNYSVAWRTLDAQYWGVPQRRKRIYLVADFTGRCAREISFKPESLRGDMPQSNEKGQETTADVMGSVDGSVGIGINGEIAGTLDANYYKGCGLRQGVEREVVLQEVVVYSFDSLSSNSMKSSNPISGCREVEISKCIDTTYPDPSKNQGGVAVVECMGFDMYNQASTGDKTRTLKTPVGGDDLPVVVLNDQGGSSININNNGISPTLRAQSHQHEPVIAMATQQGGAEVAENLCPTITAAAGMSGNNQPVIAFAQNQRDEVRDLGDKAGALAAEAGVHQQTYVAQPVIALQANGIDRADTAGCNGCGWRENECYTLNTVDRHAVYSMTTGSFMQINKEKSPTLAARDYKDPPCINDVAHTVRRLTPTECARLQGFPDWWGCLAPYNPNDADFWEDVRKTHAEINGKSYKPVKDIKKWYDKLHTDSAEYKMWGNGIALPNALYVLQGIAEQGAKTLGSLFDGSGGFPLAGVLCGIEPIWASEVEPYPIAVTKSRFSG